MFVWNGHQILEVGDAPTALGNRSIGDPFPQYWHKNSPLGFSSGTTTFVGAVDFMDCPTRFNVNGGSCDPVVTIFTDGTANKRFVQYGTQGAMFDTGPAPFEGLRLESDPGYLRLEAATSWTGLANAGPITLATVGVGADATLQAGDGNVILKADTPGGYYVKVNDRLIVNESGVGGDPVFRVESASNPQFIMANATIQTIGFNMPAVPTYTHQFQVGQSGSTSMTVGFNVPDATANAWEVKNATTTQSVMRYDSFGGADALIFNNGVAGSLDLQVGASGTAAPVWAYFLGTLAPRNDNTHNIGEPAQRWKDGYFSGTVWNNYSAGPLLSLDDGVNTVTTISGATHDMNHYGDFTNWDAAGVSQLIDTDTVNMIAGINVVPSVGVGRLQTYSDDTVPVHFLRHNIAATASLAGAVYRGFQLDYDYNYNNGAGLGNNLMLPVDVAANYTTTATIFSLDIPLLARWRFTGDAATQISTVGLLEPWSAVATSAHPNQPSEGWYHFKSECTGAATTPVVSVYGLALNNGTADCVAFKASARSGIGHTGGTIGLQVSNTPAATAARSVGVLAIPGTFVAANRRVGLRSSNGAVMVGSSNLIVDTADNQDPSTVVSTHLNFLTTSGQALVRGVMEVDGILYADSQLGVALAGAPTETVDVGSGRLRTRGGRRKAYVAKSAGYTATTSDEIIGVDSSGGTVTITLPAAATVASGTVYTVKDEGGAASTNKITIDGNGAETIDGAATHDIIVDYDSRTVYTDGTGWYII